MRSSTLRSTNSNFETQLKSNYELFHILSTLARYSHIIFQYSSHLNLCINPFVAPKVYIQLPKEMKNLVIDYMMTPAASIKNIRSQIDWFSQIAEVEQTFVPPDNLSEGKTTK